MAFERELNARSGGQCELCESTENLATYIVSPRTGSKIEECIHACASCRTQMDNPDQADANHWRCLNDSMWSEHPAVQVTAYRMLFHLKKEGWPADLMDMLYLDEDTLT